LRQKVTDRIACMGRKDKKTGKGGGGAWGAPLEKWLSSKKKNSGRVQGGPKTARGPKKRVKEKEEWHVEKKAPRGSRGNSNRHIARRRTTEKERTQTKFEKKTETKKQQGKKIEDVIKKGRVPEKRQVALRAKAPVGGRRTNIRAKKTTSSEILAGGLPKGERGGHGGRAEKEETSPDMDEKEKEEHT